MDAVFGRFFHGVQPLLPPPLRGLWTRCHRHPEAQVAGCGGLRGAARAHGPAVHAHPHRLCARAGQTVPDRRGAVAGRCQPGPHGRSDPLHERNRAQGARHQDSVAFPGLSIAGFSAAPNEGIVFFGLDDFENRTSADKSKFAILGAVNGAIQQIQGARMFVAAPAVDGLGAVGGFAAGAGPQRPRRASALRCGLGPARSALRQPGQQHRHAFSTYDINVPQLFCQCRPHQAPNRWACPARHLRHLQINLGSLYVNDFSKSQDLPGHRASRTRLPRQCRGHYRAEDAQRSQAPWCRWAP